MQLNSRTNNDISGLNSGSVDSIVICRVEGDGNGVNAATIEIEYIVLRRPGVSTRVPIMVLNYLEGNRTT